MLNSPAMNSPTPLLTMRGITKAFPGLKALNGVDLTLRAGEIHALMGENGAGKSTLIKTLTGVYTADSGAIELAGRPINPRSTREAEAAGISTVYQEVNLIPTLSIADNILLGRQPTRFGLLKKHEIAQRAEKALARLGLKLDVHRPLTSISIAEQQLVAIARALDIEAKVLILDEPTSSLDERESKFLFDIMRRLRDEGMALLFVTHFLDQVYAVSNRITVLRNGNLVGEYAVADLPRLKLISAMLGREFEEMKRIENETVAEAKAPKKAAFLTARGLGKKTVMNPIDFEIAQGEVLGLAGLLGSGRTETAKMLFGVAPADTGETEIANESAAIRSPRQAVRKGLAYCTEDRKTEGIIPNLSVRENMILAMQASRGPLRLLSRKEQSTITDQYIRALNIKTPTPETPISNLSGGNQQKVLLARWLCMEPKLFILDEPTRGIDVGAKAEIEKLVNSLRDRGMAVLFISSELEEVLRVSQRIVVLRDRKKIGELSAGSNEHAIMDLIARSE
jgi:simple sugar transport system ATP-binding protein